MSLGVWQWWAFEIFSLISTYMSPESIAAQTVLKNIALLFFMIPLGISVASSVLVGNFIGAGDISESKYYTKMCLLTGLIWSFLSILVMNVLKSPIITIFSSSESVND